MDAASIEQMNKVRVSLGMAPLPVPGEGPQFKAKDDSDSDSESDDLSTLDKRQAAAGNNWQKLEAERQEKLDRQKRKDAAKKARDIAARYAKLEGKGLGEADDGEGELDTRAWLKQQKKRQKDIEKARKMEEELAAREQQAEYTSKDLAGVRVGHEADEFDETTGEQILTLKDAEIGEESEDDELENADLKAKEKLEERQRLKKKRPDYDPMEQGEQQQGVLSKYDDEIDGRKRKRFTLDGEGNTTAVANQVINEDGQMKGKGVKISLDMLKDDAPLSDYLDPSTIKVKKPKKKKEKKTRQKAADDDDIFPVPQPVDTEAMQLDEQPTNGTVNSKKRTFDFNSDDEDLQAQLAASRRQTLKKRKKMDAAELARQMREEMAVDEENADDGGWTMDETSEFVANLKKPEAAEVQDRQSRTPQPANAASPDSEDEDGDTAMAGQSYADVEEAAERKRDTFTPVADVTATGLDNEETMTDQGIGASLALLRKRGLVNASADEKLSDRERARSKFLAEKQHLIDDFDLRARQQREEERRRGTWDKMTNRDREAYQKQQNEARERYLNQLLDDEFKRNYKPNVELRYTDEFGRAMNQKEAFKHMSHMFHGKGSGKGKTEKRLKKIEDERKERMKGVLNVGAEEGGMSAVQGREGKKNKQAGVRLQ